MTTRKCLYIIRLKSTDFYFTGQNDMRRFFYKAPPIGHFAYDVNDPDGNKRRYTHYVSDNPHDAALYVEKENAEKAIRDATRSVKKWYNGYISLPIDDCEIVPVTFNVG